MASEERTKESLKGLHDAVLAFKEDRAVELSRAALREGVDPYTAVVDGLAAGMREAGERYNRQEYFVPELLVCADALYAGLNILRPAVTSSGREAKLSGSIVLGVVEGDVHDIGKNLVKMMFDVAGWTVYDLGKDVPLEKFVEEHLKTDSDIVAMSALMTTSMVAIPKAIEMIRAKNPKAIIMVGGAPINADVALRYGADGYAETAGTAVEEASRLIAMVK